MSDATNWVAEAIKQLGGPSETVRKVWEQGVRTSYGNLTLCRRRGKIVDADLACVLAELTGISVFLLAGRGHYGSGGGGEPVPPSRPRRTSTCNAATRAAMVPSLGDVVAPVGGSAAHASATSLAA